MQDRVLASVPLDVARDPRRALPRAASARASRGRHKAPNTAILRAGFTALAAALDAAAILAVATLTGALYAHGSDPHSDLVLGLTVAALFLVPNLLRHDYAISRYLSLKGHVNRVLALWNLAVAMALVLAFVTKTSADYSRGASFLLFAGGFGAVLGTRALLVRAVKARAVAGLIAARRIFLVGDEGMIRAFTNRHAPGQVGLRLVGASVLRPGRDDLADDLALAAAAARVLRPDDVYILVPWSEHETLERCMETFLRVPAAIHLTPERFFDRFDDLHVVRTGAIASIRLVRRPLSVPEIVAKRAFDILVSATALALFSPILAAMALAIKLDSPGPVLFRQRRYGFNQEPFRILKFRSMRTMEDDRALRQVGADDPRVTRVGRFMRRTNLDELPQLVNVLRGDMSLVGPRPHALAHDQAFERDVALYARRHNVRPGITGWAQVNGWRGETDTPEKVRGRVEHDLYYIDHWSLWLDLMILVRTVVSRKAYRNAV